MAFKKAAAKKKIAPKSKYAGVKARNDGPPIITKGKYRLRLIECEETTGQPGVVTHKTTVEVVMSEGATAMAAGARAVILNRVMGGGAAAGLSRVKAIVMAFGGFEDEAGFDEADPEMDLAEAAVGNETRYSVEEGDGNPLVGRLADCIVSADGDKLNKDTGAVEDYWRGFSWSTVDEDEQEVGPPQPFESE